MKAWIGTILMIVCSLTGFRAMGSHIVGGEVTYKFIGAVSGGNKYEITLVIYEDCLNARPGAISDDDPAFMAVYDTSRGAGPSQIVAIDTLMGSVEALIVPVNFSNSCVTNIPAVCLRKNTFRTTFILPPNAAGYYVSYQRCCRNAAVVNILNAGNEGATYYCNIPPNTLVANNNSAVFKNYPPQIICRNNPLYYDHSATDADGDSLSYEFCTAAIGASSGDAKPNPFYPPYVTPPYTNVTYSSGYSAAYPLPAYPILQINPITGIITGTPNRIGRYLVTICCNEWRHGVLINTVKREFQFVVTDCSKAVFACIPQYSTDINTYIVECTNFTVHFTNCSSGGFAYHWDFGVPGTNADTSDDFQPSYTYADTGIYTVKLIINPGSTCPDSISRFVKIFPYFHTAFADSGTYCPEKPIFFTDRSSATIKPITNWTWTFGDGESADTQNVVHQYKAGGTYNVMLVSQNIKNCIDTFVRQVVVENYKPFAGHDTIIVKGESVQFNATGGYQYLWSPSIHLNNPLINNPVGYYPDTGTFYYAVHVTSAFGCEGDDTMKVWVVNQAAFYVPNAFTPNGDGKNDIFRPVSIGYRSLKYFRVYNRFGEEVYYSQTITDGWDGTYKHKPCDMGTYFWQISYVDRFGRDGYMKGDVTLVK